MSDMEARVSALEARQREQDERHGEFKTLKRIGFAIVGAVAVQFGGWIVMQAQMQVRLDNVEHAVTEHVGAGSHRGTAEAVGELRADLRVLAQEVRQINTTTQEVRSRVERIEDLRFAVPPVATPHR